jgi:hypothetical protein
MAEVRSQRLNRRGPQRKNAENRRENAGFAVRATYYNIKKHFNPVLSFSVALIVYLSSSRRLENIEEFIEFIFLCGPLRKTLRLKKMDLVFKIYSPISLNHQ